MANSTGNDGSGWSGIGGIWGKWYVYIELSHPMPFTDYNILLAAGLNSHVSVPSEAASAADADITFPDVSTWVTYCDRLPKRRRAQLGTLGNRLTQQGFFEIDQLTKDRISHSDLAQGLDIGIGTAALIVRYAEEDVAQVRAGTFNMDSV